MKCWWLRGEGHVEFVDFTLIVAREYQLLDLIVVAFRWETFLRVILEAMASGKPAVATRRGEGEKIIVGDDSGILVPLQAPLALAEAIHSIWVREDKGAEMGRNGRNAAVENFSLDAYRTSISALMAEALNGARRIG